MTIKTGLVGIGGYAGSYVRLFQQLHQAGEITFSCAAIRPQDDIPEISARLRELGVKIYPDADRMIEEEKLDLIALPIGIGQHCSYTLKALKQNINVIVEKPAAGSTAEVLQMIRAEKEGSAFVTVGFQQIHTQGVRKLKEELCSKKYGAIKQISVIGIAPRNDAYYHRNNWVCKEKGPNNEPVYDSPINNAFAHYLNIALFLSGERFDCSAHANRIQAELYRARKEIETFDTCAVRFKTQNQINILALFSHASAETVPQTIKIECEKAVALWRIPGDWSITDHEQNLLAKWEEKDNQAQLEMLKRVIARIRNNAAELLCPLEIAYEHTFCIEEMHKYFKPRQLPDDAYQIRKEDGQHIISGIETLFMECFNRNQLPSESGIPWAHASEEITL